MSLINGLVVWAIKGAEQEKLFVISVMKTDLILGFVSGGEHVSLLRNIRLHASVTTC